jgi:hypothetical protein
MVRVRRKGQSALNLTKSRTQTIHRGVLPSRPIAPAPAPRRAAHPRRRAIRADGPGLAHNGTGDCPYGASRSRINSPRWRSSPASAGPAVVSSVPIFSSNRGSATASGWIAYNPPWRGEVLPPKAGSPYPGSPPRPDRRCRESRAEGAHKCQTMPQSLTRDPGPSRSIPERQNISCSSGDTTSTGSKTEGRHRRPKR